MSVTYKPTLWRAYGLLLLIIFNLGGIMLYEILIEETYSGYVEIEAISEDDAIEVARQYLDNGNINPHEDFNGDTFIEVCPNIIGVKNA